jgi:hypothetical protein
MTMTVNVRRGLLRACLALALAAGLAACGTQGANGDGNGDGPDPGALEVTVTGLGGIDAIVNVTGPGGFDELVTASTTFVGIEPGSYSVTAQTVVDGGDTYEPTVSDPTVDVPEGGTASVTVTYVRQADPGALEVTIDGLGAGVDGDVTVTGPGGFTAQLTATDTLNDLVPGTYSITAASVQDGGQTYTATVVPDEVEVPEGATASTTVTYALAPLADDGDSEVDPGIWAQFRVTAGAPVWVDRMLFNEDDVLDVKGIELRNEVGEPDDPEDWLQFGLVHGDSDTTTISVTLECSVQLEDGAPPATIIGRAEVRDLDGDVVDLILCGDTESVVIDNLGGSTDHQIRVYAATSNDYYVRYVLSVNAYCFQQCDYQPLEP